MQALILPKLNDLVREINASWKHKQLMSVEQFLLSDLIPDTIRRLLTLPRPSIPSEATYYKILCIPTYDDLV